MVSESFSPSVAETAEHEEVVGVEVQLMCERVQDVSVVVVEEDEEGDIKRMGEANSIAVLFDDGETVMKERVSVPLVTRNNGQLIFDVVVRENAMLSNLTSPPLMINHPRVPEVEMVETVFVTEELSPFFFSIMYVPDANS